MNGYKRALASCLALAIGGCTPNGSTYIPDRGPLLVAPETARFVAAENEIQPIRHLGFSVEPMPDRELWIVTETDGSVIDRVDYDPDPEVGPRIALQFQSPSRLEARLHRDTVYLRACYDAECQSELSNSPFAISIEFDLTSTGLPVLPIAASQPLQHDVVDAEYSASLDRIIIVSAHPQPALYSYDPASGNEQSLALDKAPTAVSISPDGRWAAAAHDALITHVDLTRLDDPLAGAKKNLAVSASLADVVLAANGYVYGFPKLYSSYDSIRAVHIASGTETSHSGRPVHGGTRARLHPSGTRIYGANNGVSPSDIERYGIGSGNAVYDYDSPYHGDHEPCGNVWVRGDGAHLYTACGYVFRAAESRAQDMLYAGSVPLTEPYGRVRALSQSGTELVLIETRYECEYDPSRCAGAVGFYDSEHRTLIERYQLGPLQIEGQAAVQHGLFFFHGSGASNRYMISRAVRGSGSFDYHVARLTFTPSSPPAPEMPATPVPVVNPSTEPGLPPAPVTNLQALPFDVIDAEYSAPLDAIVAVSTFPRNALHVIPVTSGSTRSYALRQVPTTVTLGPDGLRAGVGHDGAITLLDLNQSPASAIPTLWPASIPVSDIVLAGNGYAYSFPGRVQFETIRSIAIATGAETRSTGSISPGAISRLHPSGTRMYAANGGRLERLDIGTGTAQFGPVMPPSSNGACGNLWFSEDGTTIYTACGNTFKASDGPEQDRVYGGAFPLSEGTFPNGYSVTWASHSAETQELAVIEETRNRCGSSSAADECHSHVAYYDSFLARTARYSLSPWTLGHSTHAVRGRFIFHSSNGRQQHLILRLEAAANPYAEYWLASLE